MTTIVAKIRDSRGQPIELGLIRVTLVYDLAVDDISYTPQPADVTLNSSGEASFNLAPSESANTPYKFEVFSREWNGGGYNEYPVRAPFYAVIPDLAEPLPFVDLIPTGVGNDALDTSFTSIIRRLYTSEDFWDRLQTTMFTPRGLYSPTDVYSRGHYVLYQGWTFVYVNATPGTAPAPVIWEATAHWYPWASRGADGSGTTGSDAVYDAGAWSSSLTAVSQKAIHQMLGTTIARQSAVTGFANAVDGTLTRPVLAANPTGGDNSLLVPSTSWVKAITDELAKAVCPIGTLAGFAGTSAPARWILCDGRTVSRTTYAALFAVVSTTYNTGGEAGTDFRLPDLRGRSLAGPDNMSALRGAASRLTTNGTLGASGGTETTAINYINLPTYPSGDEFANQGTQTGGSFANRVMVTRQGSTATPLPNLPPYQVANWIIYAGV